MNVPTPRILVIVAVLLTLAALAGGFAFGALLGGDAGRRDAGAEAPVAAIAPRDPLAPLAVLGAREHWGRYRAPAEQDAAPASEPRRSFDRNAIERDFVLVGIEGREPRLLALLLPREAEPRTAGSDEVIRLRGGDTLVTGVTVSAIGKTSVSFATGDGTATLQLYENIP